MFKSTASMFLLGMAVSGMAVCAAGKLAPADSTFIRKAAEGGIAEVKLGQLAKDKASNQKVKDFGNRIVNDHGKANDELKELASKKGITLRDSLDAKHQATYDRLSKLSGDAFDKAYMREMIRDHEEDVAEFRRESQSAKDPDVRQFASKTLPTLEEHLPQAQDIGTQLGIVTKNSGKNSGGATARKQQ